MITVIRTFRARSCGIMGRCFGSSKLRYASMDSEAVGINIRVNTKLLAKIVIDALPKSVDSRSKLGLEATSIWRMRDVCAGV